MSKLIAAMNLTLDGYCDHTAGVPDEEIHDHYTKLLNSGGAILYGRTTYQLMENFWPGLVKNPSGEKSMDDFARAIQNIPKVVFSRTLKTVSWENTRLASRSLAEEAKAMKQEPGKDVFVASPSLISALTNLNLFDEYQLCVHPVILGSGLPLFKNVPERIVLRLIKTEAFHASGAVLSYYEPMKK